MASDTERVIKYLANHPNALLREISTDLHIKTGSYTAPLNQVLIQLRESGRVTVAMGEWGDPRFTLTDDTVTRKED